MTGVQTCALPISHRAPQASPGLHTRAAPKGQIPLISNHAADHRNVNSGSESNRSACLDACSPPNTHVVRILNTSWVRSQTDLVPSECLRPKTNYGPHRAPQAGPGLHTVACMRAVPKRQIAHTHTSNHAADRIQDYNAYSKTVVPM